MARILCVEDSQEFQVYLSSILRGHVLTHVSTISDALRAVEGGRANYDLILLDVSLPDGNGMKILPQLKEALDSKMVPVVVISSDNDTLTKVAAFGVGADDYISKPPDSSELKARVEAKLRWASSLAGNNSIVSYEGVFLDSEKISVEVMGTSGRKPVDVTPIEFKILKLLLGRPGQVFSRDHIIERIWGVGRYVTPRTVDAHVSHLRSKMMTTRVQIETVLSAGYKISKKENSLDLGNS
jgi:two-component system, OmpR family, phosphate regulon response regulator PhoB